MKINELADYMERERCGIRGDVEAHGEFTGSHFVLLMTEDQLIAIQMFLKGAEEAAADLGYALGDDALLQAIQAIVWVKIITEPTDA